MRTSWISWLECTTFLKRQRGLSFIYPRGASAVFGRPFCCVAIHLSSYHEELFINLLRSPLANAAVSGTRAGLRNPVYGPISLVPTSYTLQTIRLDGCYMNIHETLCLLSQIRTFFYQLYRSAHLEPRCGGNIACMWFVGTDSMPADELLVVVDLSRLGISSIVLCRPTVLQSTALLWRADLAPRCNRGSHCNSISILH